MGVRAEAILVLALVAVEYIQIVQGWGFSVLQCVQPASNYRISAVLLQSRKIRGKSGTGSACSILKARAGEKLGEVTQIEALRFEVGNRAF